jgi:hypothetical protein
MTKINHNQSGRRHNALTTGAYSKSGVLPWESAEEHAAFSAAVLSDYNPRGFVEELAARELVDTLWQGRRLKNMTAIAVRCNPVGAALERSGAKSWAEALVILHERQASVGEQLGKIATSLQESSKALARLVEQIELADDLEQDLRKILDLQQKRYEQLERLEARLDGIEKFLQEFSADHVLRRMEVESALGAQFDKKAARLQRIQEARLIREKLKAESAGADRNGGCEAAVVGADHDDPTDGADATAKVLSAVASMLAEDDDVQRTAPSASPAAAQSPEPDATDLDAEDLDEWGTGGNQLPDVKHSV